MSGAALRYWRERLEDVCPYYNKKFLQTSNGTLYAGSVRSNWPDAINTLTLYSDFLAWFHNNYVLPIEGPPPKPPHVRAFYATLKDFLFLNGSRVRQRKVLVPRNYMGSTFMEKRYQRFIHLGTWAEHVDMFEKLTKSSVKSTHSVASAEAEA